MVDCNRETPGMAPREPTFGGHHGPHDYLCVGECCVSTLTKVFPAGVAVTLPSRTISVALMSFP